MPAKISFSTDRNSPAVFSRALGANSAFAKQAIARGAVEAYKKVDRIGQEAVAEVNRRVAELYNPRDGRRHKNGQEHLHGSFYYEIQSGNRTSRGNPTFPFTIMLMSDADERHVMALNRGSKPHTITPRNTDYLWFPKSGLGASTPYKWSQQPKRLQQKWLTGAPGRVKKPLQHANSPAAQRQARLKSVWMFKKVEHPGIRASYFMEYSLEVAADRVLRTNVRIKKSR